MGFGAIGVGPSGFFLGWSSLYGSSFYGIPGEREHHYYTIT